MSLLRVAIVAGEESGDILGAGLIASIKKQYPDAIIEGIGGERMQHAGCHSLFPMERLAVMGFIDPLKRLPELWRIRKSLCQHFKKNPPDVFVGIDAPSFNLGLSRLLKKSGIKTIQYVSPSVWAWRKNRIKKMLQNLDSVLTLFPFEAAFYEKHNMPHTFVGHPLAQAISTEIDAEQAKVALGLPEASRVVAVLPGSRFGELKYIAPSFFQAAQLCHKAMPSLMFVVPCLNEAKRAWLQARYKGLGCNFPVSFVIGHSREAMAASEVVLLASGTATLEAMLLKRPMVVGYRMHPITYRIAKWLVKIPFIALPNILMNRLLVPELIQADATPEKLSEALLYWLQHPERVAPMIDIFNRCHDTLSQGGSDKAAEAVLAIAGKV